MADSNTALIALGLDTSQFSDAMNSSVGSVNSFLQTAAHLDREMRKIPIIGDAWALTFGHVAAGMAEAKLQSREFARIMSADVGTSLEGNIAKIRDINSLLKDIREGSLSRNVSRFVRNAWNKADFLKGQSEPQKEDQARYDQEEKLIEIRKEAQKSMLIAVEREAHIRSEIRAGTVLASEQAKIESEYADRTAKAHERTLELFGEEAKWTDTAKNSLQAQLFIAEGIRDIEKEAAQRRALNRQEDRYSQVLIAQAQAQGNERDVAAEELQNARDARARMNAMNSSKDEMSAGDVAVSVARFRLEAAEKEYGYAVDHLAIETQLMELELEGQTRAANQAKIRAQYEVEIAKQKANGNKELAQQLEKQRDLAKLSEDVREYKLGARGRASERLKERQEAQVVRIVESQNRERERNQSLNQRPGAGGLVSGHLMNTGGLISGRSAEMDRQKKTYEQQHKQVASVAEKTLTAVEKIEQHLR